MSIARYDVNSANVNRQVTFFIQAEAVADKDANIFLALKGAANQYPFYQQVAGVPTPNQELAQLRLSLVVRALSVYTVPVGVRVVADDADNAAGAVELTFEADEFGAYFNQAWTGNTTLDKHLVTNITDVLGTGGMTAAKTKNGLQSLLDSLATVSFDGGVTGPFGALSATGAIVLPDGQVTAGAPALDGGGTPSGLEVLFARAM
jgi:hypothetical protein